jgi:hypothetical protein
MPNECPECGQWKASHRDFCRICRINKDIHKITPQQWAWIGPEPNEQRRRIVLDMIELGGGDA